WSAIQIGRRGRAMNLSDQERAEVAHLVSRQCDAAARRQGGTGDEILGVVFDRVFSNLRRLPQLHRPLPHYVRASAAHEVRRALRHLRKMEAPLPENAESRRALDPMLAFQRVEEQEQLQAALSRLPATWREALETCCQAKGRDGAVARLAARWGC